MHYFKARFELYKYWIKSTIPQLLWGMCWKYRVKQYSYTPTIKKTDECVICFEPEPEKNTDPSFLCCDKCNVCIGLRSHTKCLVTRAAAARCKVSITGGNGDVKYVMMGRGWRPSYKYELIIFSYSHLHENT